MRLRARRRARGNAGFFRKPIRTKRTVDDEGSDGSIVGNSCSKVSAVCPPSCNMRVGETALEPSAASLRWCSAAVLVNQSFTLHDRTVRTALPGRAAPLFAAGVHQVDDGLVGQAAVVRQPDLAGAAGGITAAAALRQRCRQLTQRVLVEFRHVEALVAGETAASDFVDGRPPRVRRPERCAAACVSVPILRALHTGCTVTVSSLGVRRRRGSSISCRHSVISMTRQAIAEITLHAVGAGTGIENDRQRHRLRWPRAARPPAPRDLRSAASISPLLSNGCPQHRPVSPAG